MPQTLNIALNVVDRELSRRISAYLSEVGHCNLVANSTNGSAPPPAAQLVIVEDSPESGDILEKLQKLRGHDSDLAVFVVSERHDPEHIVEVMRSGAAEYLLRPVDRDKLTNAVERVRNRLRPWAPSSKGQIFSFISSKGGLGATVVAVNTAVALAQGGKGRVGLLDNSLPSGDSSVLLDLVPDRTISDVCRHFQRLDGTLLQGAMTPHASGLHFLAAPTAPEESEGIHAEHLGRVLELAKGLFDHTVVDCKSMSVDQVSVEAFKASDRIFVVTDLSVPAVRNAVRLTQLIRKLRINPSKVEVVVNRFIKGGVPPVSEIEKTLGRRIFWLFPNDFVDVISSINHGTPLVKGKPGSVLARNVMEFAARLVAPSTEDSYRGVKGFLGRAI